MFHSVFCAGSKYPQEAKLISETKKKKKKKLTITVSFPHGHYPKNGTGRQTGIYFAVIYKINFDQVFKHFVIIYKIEMF